MPCGRTIRPLIARYTTTNNNKKNAVDHCHHHHHHNDSASVNNLLVRIIASDDHNNDCLLVPEREELSSLSLSLSLSLSSLCSLLTSSSLSLFLSSDDENDNNDYYHYYHNSGDLTDNDDDNNNPESTPKSLHSWTPFADNSDHHDGFDDNNDDNKSAVGGVGVGRGMSDLLELLPVSSLYNNLITPATPALIGISPGATLAAVTTIATATAISTLYDPKRQGTNNDNDGDDKGDLYDQNEFNLPMIRIMVSVLQ